MSSHGLSAVPTQRWNTEPDPRIILVNYLKDPFQSSSYQSECPDPRDSNRSCVYEFAWAGRQKGRKLGKGVGMDEQLTDYLDLSRDDL